jgi:hypothetical protein
VQGERPAQAGPLPFAIALRGSCCRAFAIALRGSCCRAFAIALHGSC